MEDLSAAFTASEGERLTIVYGATGKLYAQIRSGAPFHVLLAADQERPRRLVEDGFGLAGTRFTYALGGLSLWSADPGLAGRLGPGLLSDPSLRHIAVANPDLAPYGAAAMDVLAALDLQEGVKDRLVFGENVAQAHALVASRAATVGFTARSLVLAAGIGEDQRWDIPSDLHKPIAQDAVLTRAGSQNQTARSFLSFLRGDEAGRIIARYGYARP